MRRTTTSPIAGGGDGPIAMGRRRTGRASRPGGTVSRPASVLDLVPRSTQACRPIPWDTNVCHDFYWDCYGVHDIGAGAFYAWRSMGW
jgi:hypothetical protein